MTGDSALGFLLAAAGCLGGFGGPPGPSSFDRDPRVTPLATVAHDEKLRRSAEKAERKRRRNMARVKL